MQKNTFFTVGLIAFTLFSCTHFSRGPASLAPSQLQVLEDNYLQALDREAKDVKKNDQSKPILMSGERLFTESAPKAIVRPFEHGCQPVRDTVLPQFGDESRRRRLGVGESPIIDYRGRSAVKELITP